MQEVGILYIYAKVNMGVKDPLHVWCPRNIGPTWTPLTWKPVWKSDFGKKFDYMFKRENVLLTIIDINIKFGNYSPRLEA